MLIAEAVMVGGYFAYSLLIVGSEAAAAIESIPGNVLQGVVGIVGAVLLLQVFCKNKALQKLLDGCRK